VRVAEEQNSAFLLKALISIMDYAPPCGKAYFIEIFPAVDTRCSAVSFYLKHIKAFQLQFVIKFRYQPFVIGFHPPKLRKSKHRHFSDLLAFSLS
jgi:hypothetical protein